MSFWIDSYRAVNTLLGTYSKRNPIVVLHNVYMDQNQSCLSDWYDRRGNKQTFLKGFSVQIFLF